MTRCLLGGISLPILHLDVASIRHVLVLRLLYQSLKILNLLVDVERVLNILNHLRLRPFAGVLLGLLCLDRFQVQLRSGVNDLTGCPGR